MKCKHAGTGDVSITVGEFRGVKPYGEQFHAMGGIHVETGGDISITASGHVDGAGPGIDNMSIWTKSTVSKDVTVTLNSGAVLDRGVRDGAGNASVTINAGATVREPSVSKEAMTGSISSAEPFPPGGSMQAQAPTRLTSKAAPSAAACRDGKQSRLRVARS